MKRYICILLVIVAMCFAMTGCGDPYYDPDTNNLDTSALAIDALDKAFPEITENITEEQLFELLEDDRCGKILKDYLIEQMSGEDAAMEEYCTVKEAKELMIYAFGDEGDGWSDNLTPITGAEIIEKCN